MNIRTFPNLKRRHIVLWRIVIWFILTFYELPKRLLLWMLDFPLEVIYNAIIFVRDTLGGFAEVSCNIWGLLVRYVKVCKYLIHATVDDDK